MYKKFLLLIFLFSVSLTLHATLTMASVLNDNMVLQRNSEVKIWGEAEPMKKVVVSASWCKSKFSVLANSKGEWIVTCKTNEAGGPYSISVVSGKEKIRIQNVLLGEVWLCSGQSNMEMFVSGFGKSPINGSTDLLLNADQENIRLFTVAKASKDLPQERCKGKWDVASTETVANFSAVGYFFALQLQKKLHVPVGIICSSWGGSRIEAWMDMETIAQFPEALKQSTQKDTRENSKASYLYNGMIAPLLHFTFKGVLWYQGEANIGNYNDYAALQTSLVKSWRADFGIGEFPFYFVQIAPYNYSNPQAAFLREAQYHAMLNTPNSGMVCTFDIGEEHNIHPAEKETVSKRLALWALAKTYDIKALPYLSPSYKNMELKDSVAIISFDGVLKGLVSNGKDVACFEIAGQDSVFYPAKITIASSTVQVYSPKVKTPIAVRYGFRNFMKSDGFLYNTAGLPVIPFRTDGWIK